MIFSRSEINWNVRNDQELARKRAGVNHRQLITRLFRPLSLIKEDRGLTEENRFVLGNNFREIRGLPLIFQKLKI